MGIGLTDIFNVASGGMGLMGGAANLAQTGLGLAQYFQRQRDPLFRSVEQMYVDRINGGQNPFGNPYNGMGGAFGSNADGSPMNYGDFAGRAQLDMLNNMMAGTQANANAIGNLAGMQRPGGHGNPAAQAGVPMNGNTLQNSQVMGQTNTAPPSMPNPTAQLPNRPQSPAENFDPQNLFQMLMDRRQNQQQAPPPPNYGGAPTYQPPTRYPVIGGGGQYGSTYNPNPSYRPPQGLGGFQRPGGTR